MLQKKITIQKANSGSVNIQGNKNIVLNINLNKNTPTLLISSSKDVILLFLKTIEGNTSQGNLNHIESTLRIIESRIYDNEILFEALIAQARIQINHYGSQSSRKRSNYLLSKAFKIVKNDKIKMARCLHNMALNYFWLKEPVKAIKYANFAAQCLSSIKNLSVSA